MDGYRPIEDYALIGNLETCALVGVAGSIDWCCFPHLESPSVFARLLDAEDGGHFTVRPTDEFESSQSYVERTNVLETTFETASGTATITTFMPVSEVEDESVPEQAIFRRIACTDGSASFLIEFRPRFDYARARTTVAVADGGVLATRNAPTTAREATEPETVYLSGRLDWNVSEGEDAATAPLDLESGDARWLVLCYDGETPVTDREADRSLERTVEYWRSWAHTCDESRCVFGGPWHDAVVRSGLVLKLLTHYETGAMVAAPTTSLPETIGGVRNWDYRYNWIRDAAFTLQALSNLNHVEEATEYFDWFVEICDTDDPAEIQPLYGLHGETELEEVELPHLPGYRGSAPVRIGNEASDQRQLDVYGELLLAVDEMVRSAATLDGETWAAVENVVDYVADVWTETDASIWEVRSQPQHFVFSKVMCWAALDRGIEIARRRGFDAPIDEWRAERRAIKREVLDRGVHPDHDYFRRSYGSNALDASTLLVPFVGFLPFGDHRVQATIDAVDERLATDDGLVRRYDGEDGLPGEEGAFLLCSFWLVGALALSGRVDEAESRFERVLEYTSPLGLLAEEVDPETGHQLGNYPQAFSHIGLINAALYLGRARGREVPGVEPIGTALGGQADLDGEDA